MTRGELSTGVYLLSLVLSLSLIDLSLSSSVLPEIGSYSKVSINRAQPIVAIPIEASDRQSVSQSRSLQKIVTPRSPIYVPSTIAKLRNGEAIDHTPAKKYTTLDRDAVAQLDAVNSRKSAQKRFHPPASFEHVLAHANAMREQSIPSPSEQSIEMKKTPFPVPGYATLPQEVYSSSYDYQQDSKPTNEDSPPGGSDDYTPDSGDSFSKIPDSYAKPETYGGEQIEDVPKFAGFPTSSSYEDKYPSKPVDFPDHYEHSSYGDVPFASPHDYHHDLIYEHPPDDHYHDYTTTTTTEEPEMNDQRLSKRPYSYYYIGKKLWYLPLYFSIYFIIYIAALVLKSITRHKINFPASLAAVAAQARNGNELYEGYGWYELTKRVLDGIDLYNSIGKSNS